MKSIALLIIVLMTMSSMAFAREQDATSKEIAAKAASEALEKCATLSFFGCNGKIVGTDEKLGMVRTAYNLIFYINRFRQKLELFYGDKAFEDFVKATQFGYQVNLPSIHTDTLKEIYGGPYLMSYRHVSGLVVFQKSDKWFLDVTEMETVVPKNIHSADYLPMLKYTSIVFDYLANVMESRNWDTKQVATEFNVAIFSFGYDRLPEAEREKYEAIKKKIEHEGGSLEAIRNFYLAHQRL